MVTLADINTDLPAGPKLEDFNPPSQVAGSVLNSATVTAAAAHAAVLSGPDNVLRNYGLISTELSQQDKSPTLENVLRDNQELDRGVLYTEVNRILSDPTVSVEEKASYVNGYVNSLGDSPGNRTLSTLVAQKAVNDPVEQETDETIETATFDYAKVFDSSDEYRGLIQKEVNLQLGVQNRQWYDWGLDFVENMVPFLEQGATAKSAAAQGDLGTAFKSLLLPGDTKAQWRDALKKMPPDKRLKAAQSLIEMVKNSQGSILPRTNTLNMINQLNAALVSGSYKDGDQLADNIFAVVDAVLPFAGAFGKFAKGTRAAADLERAADVERKAMKVATDVEETITKAIPSEEIFNADKTTLNGLKQLVHDKLSPHILNAPFEQQEAALKKIDELVTQPNLSNPSKLAKDISQVVSPIIGTTKKADKSKVVQELEQYIIEESNINRLMVRSIEDHQSLAATFRNSSPKKARDLAKMVEADETDQAAKATYGTTRTEAIVSDRAPEVGMVDKSVRSKVEMDEAGPAPNANIVASISKDRGRTDLSQMEKQATRNVVVDAFQNINGLVPRKAMATIDENTYKETPTGASFNMVYGPKDGGFVSAQQGVYQVLNGLKKYGVTEKEVEVLARDIDGKYHVVTGVPTEKGNYLVRVKHDYEFGPADVIWQTLEGDKNYRMFQSRMSNTSGASGTFLQHLIPSSSIIHKVIFNSASVAADRSARIQKQLVKLASEYAQSYKKLSKEQKALVDSYIIEANNKGIPFSAVNLKARGFNDSAIQTMRDWKETTDTMWYLENVDLNKNLRGLGWERFVDPGNDTDLIARRVSNRNLAGAKVYDPTTNAIRKIDAKELKELYEKDGTLAELKRPLNVGDDDAEFILVKEGGAGYLRKIRDEDSSLPYRDGYYPIKYDAPIFIRQHLRTKDGKPFSKAVAVAGNHADASALLARLRAADTSTTYELTPDLKRGSSDYFNAEWDVIVSSGRSGQRVRGTRLASASSPTDLNHAFVQAPEEALISSIKSIAARTAYRDWLDSSKSRWLKHYGHLINAENGNQWPTSLKQIGRNLEHSNMLVKDAKVNWQFINSMENGYVNLLDDASKNFFANFADTASRNGWGWLEKPTRALAKAGPTSFARKKAFRLLLAANPLRQLPVQAMQALPVLLATNPLAIPKITTQMLFLDYLANAGDANSFMRVMGKVATGMDSKQAARLADDWERSGFEASVDANSLIRDQMGSLISRTPLQKVSRLAAKPLDFTQKIGFNTGEQMLMRSVWLSEYDLATKGGKVLNAEDLENLNARVRNLTLNMNKAGEMPYNENMFSAAAQFFQAPHKAFAQILLGHKGLTGWDRIKLGASYVLTYGIGGGFLADMVLQNFKGDPVVKDTIEGGLFNITMNTALRSLFKDETNVDFSESLRLLQQPDVFKFWNGLMRADVAELLSASPSASLIFGSNPRVTKFVQSLMLPFTVNDTSTPEEFALIGKNFADMFSGASNIFKAKYAIEHQKQMSAKGVVNDWNVSFAEGVGKALGFSTVDEVQYYASQYKTYMATDQYKQDVKTVINEVSSRLADLGISSDQEQWYYRMMSEAQRVWGNDPLVMEEFSNQIYYMAVAGEVSLYNSLKRLAGTMDDSAWEATVNSAPIPQDQKDTLHNYKKVLEGLE